MEDTYDITYQYSPSGRWRVHPGLSALEGDLLLQMLTVLDRKCRVRQNATGRVVVVEPCTCGDLPPPLLHLFFKSISGRRGIPTADDGTWAED
jgi:hypothetical protein